MIDATIDNALEAFLSQPEEEYAKMKADIQAAFGNSIVYHKLLFSSLSSIMSELPVHCKVEAIVLTALTWGYVAGTATGKNQRLEELLQWDPKSNAPTS